MFPSAPERGISVIGGAAPSFAVVWGQLVNLIRSGLIKVKLRNEFLGAPGRGIISNFEVDVNSPTGIPTRIDREEFGDPVRVRRLITAQKLFASGIEPRIHVAHIRINAERVALPNIDDSAAKRATGGASDARNMER